MRGSFLRYRSTSSHFTTALWSGLALVSGFAGLAPASRDVSSQRNQLAMTSALRTSRNFDRAPGVGFRTFKLTDPVAGMAMQAAVFYPSGVKTRSTTIGPYVIDAASGAVMSPGAFPLIALSHGSGGSCWDLHDFATYLASRRFVVACANHPGDNFQDHSGLGTDRVLIGRALQMSALIDAMLRDQIGRASCRERV